MKKERKRVSFFVSSVIAAILLSGISYSIYNEFFAKREVTASAVNDNIAPNFTLEDLEGNIVKLEDYRGKGVLLNFWATYCPPCEKEMPYLENAYHDYKDRRRCYFSSRCCRTKKNCKSIRYRKEFKFSYFILDCTGEVVDLYKVQNLPITILINEKGEITEKITGELTEKNIRKYLDSITPK